MSGADVWAGGEYALLAEQLAPIHERLVVRLDPRPGERWLDVGTGTGAIAVRAARVGADVVGIDIAPALLEQARAQADGLPIRWDEGDAQALPYSDASFDVVVSCFGAIFAPDDEAVARELARVCRPGGRLGLTAWHASTELRAVYERVGIGPQEPDPTRWSDEASVHQLLGEAFDLELEPGVWRIGFEAPELIWEWWSTAVPPFVALLESLESEKRAAMRDEMLALAERLRTNGGVEFTRDYVLVLGRRR
ncbi:MAG TPA: methyltransferase domain-containing protein [Gaiellaceae bacterium]|nr:methyltransferase domain-containing protein [Gaiellaceae bacterium]